jgi:hypothetical protein
MTPASRIVAQSALWIANSDTAHAAVQIDDPDAAIEHITKAMEALERARHAIRGW